MVNHGVSHACLTCKTRRIKCDGERPTCRKCTKSKRTCLLNTADLFFRDDRPKYVEAVVESGQATATCAPSSTVSSRKPHFDAFPGGAAMKAFLDDYVLVSKDRALSRGYFDGLKALLDQAGSDSTLVSAATIVAQASAANKDGSSCSTSSSIRYPDVLAAFKQSLDNPSKCNADAALMTAVLLVIYEMVVATEPYPFAHGTHVSGVSAILCSRKLSFEVLELPGSSLFELFNPLLPRRSPSNERVSGLLSPYPYSKTDPPTKNLDGLLIKSRPVLERAQQLLSSTGATKAELRSLKQEASLLNKEFALWPLSSQPEEWRPRTLGVMRDIESRKSLQDMPFWPGNIDSYFDLYVAAVWNIYRKARLKLMDIIVQVSERLRPLDEHHTRPSTITKFKSEMQQLVDDMCASVPFHLIADLPSCLQTESASGDLDSPGKALGGLLLMYPLYIASTLSIVTMEQRLWMQGRLLWIGEKMGIRQSAMLADNILGVSHKLVGIGHSLLFAGALMQPPTSKNTEACTTS